MEDMLVELTEEELKESDLEMVRYCRQARAEGAHPDVDSWRCRCYVRVQSV